MTVLVHLGNPQHVYKSAEGGEICHKQRLNSSEKFAAQNVMTVQPGGQQLCDIYSTQIPILFNSFFHHESLNNKLIRKSCMLIAY